MTLYLLFDALKQGKLTMQTPLPVSYHASIQKPTKLDCAAARRSRWIPPFAPWSIRSANDVAVVVAEALGGTESHFGVMMTEQARRDAACARPTSTMLRACPIAADHDRQRYGDTGPAAGL